MNLSSHERWSRPGRWICDLGGARLYLAPRAKHDRSARRRYRCPTGAISRPNHHTMVSRSSTERTPINHQLRLDVIDHAVTRRPEPVRSHIAYQSAVLPHLEITPQRPHWLADDTVLIGPVSQLQIPC